MDKKINILVAEDDFAIALALKTIINNNFNCNLSVAHNGTEAWDIVQNNDIDLIMSDWNMPIKTGCEFLRDVKASEKTRDIPFIMLTARADKDSVMQAATGGVMDYIHKPFDRAGLIEKLNGIIDTIQRPTQSNNHNNEGQDNKPKKRNIVDEIVEKLKSDDFDLPILSNVVNTVNEMLNDASTTSSELADEIKNDPVVTTRLIALSNSPIYISTRRNKTLEEAIARIGLKEIKNYLWIFGHLALFQSSDTQFSNLLTTTHIHSMVTAEAAKLIARLSKSPNPEECFYLGLMHDIGTVLVLRILEDISITHPINDEKAILDTTHALHQKFGGILLKRWCMPEIMQTIATEHEQLDHNRLDTYRTELRIIHFANLISIKLGYCLAHERDTDIVLAAHPVAKSLTLTPEQIEDICTHIHSYVAKLDSLLTSGS